jgi:2-polyprenyl-6-methoxyphenol hydroxylase-like FAD-dependent oxidoreductase
LDQIRYSEPQLLSCERWWIPGLVIIGDAAHFFGPETGVSSGIGLGDAHALAEAVRQNPDDPDAACRSYELWRAPVVRPYEAMDPGRQRMVPAGGVQARPEERWPPAD